jgi:hypothetical protein
VDGFVFALFLPAARVVPVLLLFSGLSLIARW